MEVARQNVHRDCRRNGEPMGGIMNGLYLPGRSEVKVLAATGQLIPYDADPITDIWCGDAESHANLRAVFGGERDGFYREDAGTNGNVYRVHCHLNTRNRRLFVHRSDLDEWCPLRGIPAVRSLRLLDLSLI